MKREEHEIQSSFFKWLRDRTPFRKKFFAIPNGAFIGATIGHDWSGKPVYKKYWGLLKRLEDEGLTKGVCDVFGAIPRNGKHGIYIEFKAGSNKPSKEQEEFIELMKNEGYGVYVCYSRDEAIDCLNNYLYPKEENKNEQL